MKIGRMIRSALLVATWLGVSIIVINVLALLSPWRVLVRSVTRSYVLDADIIVTVPENTRSTPARHVYRERVCAYWGGGVRLSPTFTSINERCRPFEER